MSSAGLTAWWPSSWISAPPKVVVPGGGYRCFCCNTNSQTTLEQRGLRKPVRREMKRKWSEYVSPPALTQSGPIWPWHEPGVRVFCFDLPIMSLETTTGCCLVAHGNLREIRAEVEEL